MPPIAGGDAGDDAKRNAGGGERQRLLPAAAEDQRIAALQPQHAQAVGAKRDQALVDAQLRRLHASGALAHLLQPMRGQRQDVGRDQRVVQHHVGHRQRVRGVQGEQSRIARPGPGEPYRPGGEFGRRQSCGGEVQRRVHGIHPAAVMA